jgi:Reverse transcriptase (RNA-dependent DNA polymerase).
LLLLDQLAVHIKDKRVLNLLGQYLRRTSERGGVFRDYERGISLGCPLSPLIGAFFLHALDVAATKLRLFYIRFMDDILILAPSRWQLRRAVKLVNQTLGTLNLEKHHLVGAGEQHWQNFQAERLRGLEVDDEIV